MCAAYGGVGWNVCDIWVVLGGMCTAYGWCRGGMCAAWCPIIVHKNICIYTHVQTARLAVEIL